MSPSTVDVGEVEAEGEAPWVAVGGGVGEGGDAGGGGEAGEEGG